MEAKHPQLLQSPGVKWSRSQYGCSFFGEDTQVAAVAPRAGMGCAAVEPSPKEKSLEHVKRTAMSCKVSPELSQAPCLLSRSVLLFSVISLCAKAPLLWSHTHPINDSSYLSYGLGRGTRGRGLFSFLFLNATETLKL